MKSMEAVRASDRDPKITASACNWLTCLSAWVPGLSLVISMPIPTGFCWFVHENDGDFHHFPHSFPQFSSIEVPQWCRSSAQRCNCSKRWGLLNSRCQDRTTSHANDLRMSLGPWANDRSAVFRAGDVKCVLQPSPTGTFLLFNVAMEIAGGHRQIMMLIIYFQMAHTTANGLNNQRVNNMKSHENPISWVPFLSGRRQSSKLLWPLWSP